MSTAAETIARVRARLPATSENFWSDEDLVDAYNDALDEISDATELFEQSVVVKRRKWAVYTDLRGLLPTVALRVSAVWNMTTQGWIHPTTARELDQMAGRGWEKSNGTAQWWFMRGLWFLGAFPAPPDDMSPLKVYFSSMMPHVATAGGLASGLTSSPPMPPDCEAAIDSYMMSSLMADYKETTKAVELYREYQVHETTVTQSSERRMSRERTYRIGARR